MTVIEAMVNVMGHVSHLMPLFPHASLPCCNPVPMSLSPNVLSPELEGTP